MKKILVLGGGFAGVEAAIHLRKLKYKVTLVSDRDYLFIYPISIWIPVDKKKAEDVRLSLAQLAKKHGFDLIVDGVKKIDVPQKTVELNHQEINYDILFLAMGMHKLKPKGIEHTLSICGSPGEAETIGLRLKELVKKGSGNIAIGFGGNPKDPTATSVRGGPAFELLFNISHFLKKKGVRDQFNLKFFAPMKEPGKKMGDNAFANLNKFFKRYGIHAFVGKKIKNFASDHILLEDDSRIESDLSIFISGGSGHQVVKDSDLPTNEAGFVKIDQYCQVEAIEDIYAIGDIAAIEGPSWAAKQGHLAEVMAKFAVYNMHQKLIGSDNRKMYQDEINILCIMDTGDGAAYVMRNDKKQLMIPLPIIGHWLKKAWGFYYRNSKLKRFPRIPGM